MKNLFFALLASICLPVFAQDTTCVMITLDEILHFDYETSEVIFRYDHEGPLELKVSEGEVMCLHFYDDKKSFREIVTNFDDGTHTHNVINSKDNVLYSDANWGNTVIEISEQSRSRKAFDNHREDTD